ncbi:MAG: DNA alkylation repair protein [Dysgonamonadaceae bacterium]|jgi:3-methyladenine DNA glycosylase AlkD|nr:DNA alkylation repair protein [Dysgonamonadaceae bacterium]
MTAQFILQELHSIANPEKAIFLQGFFKTGKGQYAEGDIFLGITVPFIRNIVKANKGISLPEIQTLLYSSYHEARLAALLLLVQQFKKAKEAERTMIFNFYLTHARQANNWDLVDVTCRDVIGAYLLNKKDRSVLYRLATSENLWEQRIAIISTWTFIKNGDFIDTLQLSQQLLNHKHDLMHKAVGWMLREVGKKNKKVLTDFLEEHHKNLPRTTLRYAIEHFFPEERAYFMRK